ncbi:MAG: TetR/AcrR family transcriptional regulator [Solirubrobacteraceae bacterium]
MEGLGGRSRLVRAAREVVERDGYGAASVAAIAARAGMATGALYRHFPSKGELFAEVFREVCARELEVARALPPASPLLLAETFARRALQKPQLAWALLAEPLDAPVDAARLAYRREYRSLAERHLRQAQRAGHADPGLDPGTGAAALVGAISETLIGPLSRSEQPQQQTIEALLRFCGRAIAAQPLERA